MAREKVDALFFSYYEDIDKWHNDHLGDGVQSGLTGLRPDGGDDPEAASMQARMLRQSVSIDGNHYDFARFLSWARHGTTAEYRCYSPFAPTQLAGSYFRSLLGAQGFDVRHVHLADRTTLVGLGERFDPRYVLISTTFLSEVARIHDICRRVRRLWPDAGVIVGGLVLIELQRSVEPVQFERMLRAFGADAYVLSAQSEESVIEILRHERGELARLDLPHTLVRTANGYVASSQREERHFGLEETYVRWSKLDPASLYHTVHTRTARSCAFKCAFCTFPQLQGTLELAPEASFEAELEELKRLGSVRSLIFTDDTFNVPPQRFKELCKILARYDFEWYSFFRPQFADDETAQLMSDSGCRAVFLGVEAVDDGMLKRLGKTATVAKVEVGVEALKRHGILMHANFIVGFPGDVPENAQKIVDFLDRHAIDFFYVSPWYHSPTAPISKDAEKYGVQGKYFRWKHDTMDVDQALALEAELQRAPKTSLFMSELTQNTFWGEILFYCNDYDLAETRMVVETYNAFTGRDTPSAELRDDARVVRLRALLGRKPLPVPPGVEFARTAAPTAAPMERG
ncbi:MAG: radical SAM protein [Planctomycetes bacterium]|nr:radical SAM protein [Planctomycetota bacterium]